MSDFDDVEMTTEEIEHEILWSKIDEAKPGYRKAFHRWLQSVKAEVWDEALDSVNEFGTRLVDEDLNDQFCLRRGATYTAMYVRDGNPYRKETV